MKILTLLAASLTFFGCSSDDDTAEPREETVGAEIASGYNQQMNKARNVEIQLDQHKRDLDAAIDDSDPGKSKP